MRILVTGGAGFIGSRLVRRLAERGDTVVVLDSLEGGSLENLGSVEDKIEFVKADVRDATVVDDAARGVDAIFHLAAQVSVPKSIEDPLKDAEINILGTVNLLNAALREKIKKFVFFSSAAVYGDPTEFPIKENSLINPISPYGMSKLAAETYCGTFAKLHGLNCVAFRTFNVCGNGGMGVLFKFVQAVKEGKPIAVYGDGEQSRDFIYVEDVVDGCVLALEKNCGGVYNLATGVEITVNELVSMLGKVAGKDVEVEKIDEMEGDIKRSIADITRIKQDLGFEPRHMVEDAIKEMLK